MSRVSDKPYFVYVLWSLSGERFYTGISEGPLQRDGWFKSTPRNHLGIPKAACQGRLLYFGNAADQSAGYAMPLPR